jgi:N-acyl-phosphatidylethanolamine-hydrolysing phospholipase D
LGTWLGHASAFVEMPLSRAGGAGSDREGDSGQRETRTAKLLFDPIFSGRAGPTAYTGPARIRASPCEVEDLPGCDCVFISHNQSVPSVPTELFGVWCWRS